MDENLQVRLYNLVFEWVVRETLNVDILLNGKWLEETPAIQTTLFIVSRCYIMKLCLSSLSVIS